jgi:hypothetical protein
MALVDFERVLLELEREIQSKPHHGSRELALKLAELRARHTIHETLPEEMLRLYGVQLSEDLRAAARDKLPDLQRGSPALAEGAEPGHRHDRLGGHDGPRNGREPAGAER